MAFAAMPRDLSALHAWHGHAAWRMLETDFGNGHHFLTTWAAWQADPQRSQQLHYTGICPHPADIGHGLANAPQTLQALAQLLAPQLFGLLPGVHRLCFANGQVLLTLWVGDMHTMLRQQNSTADAVLLHTPYASDSHSIKALARHCRRATALLQTSASDGALQHALQAAGFVAPDGSESGLVHYLPRWEPRKKTAWVEPVSQPGTVLVVGAGLAGAAIAHSLALRGWKVTVVAQGSAPADGASGLPAGLFCPHVSPDDSVLSRLSRSGVRLTLQRLRDLCEPGQDWLQTGVLEHCTDGGSGLPAHWPEGAGHDWSRTAQADQLHRARLPADSSACWHLQAGWVRPQALVRAQLAHSNIQFTGQTHVAELKKLASHTWQALDHTGHVVAQADLVVLASGPATQALLPRDQTWHLQALRGQVTWGLHTPEQGDALPPFPVNGNGNLVTHVPTQQGAMWVMGSTFERDVTTLPISHADQMQAHAVNYHKLHTLLPASAPALAPWFTPSDERCQATWGQIRCASHDRLPIAGPVGPKYPGLWALTALGARGLTLSVLCAELMAAQLHAEPLPLDAKLAMHLGTERLGRHMLKSAHDKD